MALLVLPNNAILSYDVGTNQTTRTKLMLTLNGGYRASRSLRYASDRLLSISKDLRSYLYASTSSQIHIKDILYRFQVLTIEYKRLTETISAIDCTDEYSYSSVVQHILDSPLSDLQSDLEEIDY